MIIKTYLVICNDTSQLYDISGGICAMLNHRQMPYIDTDAPHTHHVHTFADVYKLKWLHLRQSYELYLRCFAGASQELSLSLVKPDMSRFLQSITNKDQQLPTLYHILEQPRQVSHQII